MAGPFNHDEAYSFAYKALKAHANKSKHATLQRVGTHAGLGARRYQLTNYRDTTLCPFWLHLEVEVEITYSAPAAVTVTVKQNGARHFAGRMPPDKTYYEKDVDHEYQKSLTEFWDELKNQVLDDIRTYIKQLSKREDT
jgi:hypothetical protein